MEVINHKKNDGNDTKSMQSSEYLTQDGLPGRDAPNRWQACIPCRKDKIRCLPASPGKPCHSCLKKSRRCVMPGPPKPRVKTSQRLLELENKMRLLNHALINGPEPHRIRDQRVEQEDNTISTNGTSDSLRSSNGISTAADHFVTPPNFYSNIENVPFFSDVDSQTEHMLYNHWMLSMTLHSPVVTIKLAGDRNTCQAATPLLYLTILTVASSSILPEITYRLVNRLNEELSSRIFHLGEQTLEIVCSLLLFSHYFVPPKGSTNHIFIQHPFTASTMSFDLGLDKKALSDSVTYSEKLEAARIWLSVYYTVSVSRALVRRQKLEFEAQCIDKIAESLQTNQCATDADRRLCSLVHLQRIVEDCTGGFDSTASSFAVTFEEQAIEQQVTSLDQRLDEWKCSQSLPDGNAENLNAPNSVSSATTILTDHAYHSVRLYIYQITICAFAQKLLSRSNDPQHLDDNPVESLSPLQSQGLRNCLESAHEIFRTFISLDVIVIRALPTCYLYWNIFAAASLVKMAPFAERASATTLSKDITSPNRGKSTSTAELLKSMATKLEEVSKDGYMPQARSFLLAFKRLRVWYMQKQAFCINSRSSKLQGCGDIDHNLLARNLATDFTDADPADLDAGASTSDNSATLQHRQEKRTAMETQELESSPGPTAAQNDDQADSSGDVDMDWSFTLDSEALKQLDDFLMSQDHQWVEALL